MISKFAKSPSFTELFFIATNFLFHEKKKKKQTKTKQNKKVAANNYDKIKQ